MKPSLKVIIVIIIIMIVMVPPITKDEKQIRHYRHYHHHRYHDRHHHGPHSIFFWNTSNIIIKSLAYIYSHLTITAVFHPVHWLNSNIFFIIIIWYNWVVTTTSHPIGKVSESDGVWFRRILGTLFDEPYYTQSTKSRMNGKLENDPLITSFILILLTFHHSAEKLVKSFSP